MHRFEFTARFAELIFSGEKSQEIITGPVERVKVKDKISLYKKHANGIHHLIYTKDVICSRVDKVEIVISDLIDEFLVGIVLNGTPLNFGEIEKFAQAQGYSIDRHKLSARHAMGSNWYVNYGNGSFIGHVIHW